MTVNPHLETFELTLVFPRLQTALNEVEPTIQFSLEEEIHDSLPFLDTHIFKYEFLLDNCRQQAAKIRESRRQQDSTTRRLVLPTGDVATNLTRLLRTTNLEIVCQTSRTIKDITKTEIHNNQTPGTKAGVYRIPCSGCDKVYIGETSRDLNTRIREHRYDVRHDVTTNACVTHRNKENHLMDWKNAELLIREPDKIHRKCLEAAIIQGTNTIEQNRGMFNISPHNIPLIPMASKILNI
ncbi:uncharacterized protein LOC143024028 [Oratosquilla oratoria]|uniref:uncharacterized protein LOC143024028 n=1 Tax=Oratosquilla oratoria TaxID=337810 RepID=UPI003F75907A